MHEARPRSLPRRDWRVQLELCPERVEEDLTAHPRGVRERGAQGPLCSSLQDRGEAALRARAKIDAEKPSALERSRRRDALVRVRDDFARARIRVDDERFDRTLED